MQVPPTVSRLTLFLAYAFHLIVPLIVEVGFRPPYMGEGGDFPTYYYALRQALLGGSPYDLQALQRLSPWSVAPFLYPPPFLLSMLWTLPLSPRAGLVGMFVLNEVLLLGVLGLMRKHLGLSRGGMALLLVTFFPLWDNLLWYQVNLVLLLPVVVALFWARRRPLGAGALVGAAAVMKVLPGALALYWLLRREWRPLASVAASVLGLTLLSLPLMGPIQQWSYYTGTLLGVAGGRIHDMGIRVSIRSEYNHSVLGVFSHVWPGPSPVEPSGLAVAATGLFIVFLLAAWALRVHRGCPPEFGMASMLGIISIASTYAWEHYLVLLLPAVVLAARGSAPRWLLGTLYALTVFPLGVLLFVYGRLPGQPSPLALTPWIAGGKMVGAAGISLLCVWFAKAPDSASAPALEPKGLGSPQAL